MPIGLFENELTVQLWKPVTIRGYTFNVGDNVTLDQTKVQKTAGRRRQLRLALRDLPGRADRDRASRRFWNRLPPPLLREGNKVQTPWLTAFLQGPVRDPPGGSTCGCRGSTTARRTTSPRARPTELANYFAARDGAEFPYQAIPEREQGYLAEREQAHPGLPRRRAGR